MVFGTWIFGLSLTASHKEIKKEIDKLSKEINSYEVKLRTQFQNNWNNIKKGIIKKRLRNKFGKRIRKLNVVLEKQGIIGSEMGKQLGNEYARKIVRLRKIL
ncbi:hypothetical protein HN681_02425 [archaeon]|jgi:hypothetical protein|nr:hypothetical protein [archaeon]MBT3731289.1 hypothetical protein [archaeon]MBT4669942.1 hypothetical protein [archaeon]MBT5029767.1 hypothetical protein [archaeon]MBT5287484.1 hypothetical protein [archaeon]